MVEERALTVVESAPLAQAASAAAQGVFVRYLAAVGVVGEATHWSEEPAGWASVSWGLVEGFLVYSTQAARAGVLSPDALALIQSVKVAAPRSKAGRNRDA